MRKTSLGERVVAQYPSIPKQVLKEVCDTRMTDATEAVTRYLVRTQPNNFMVGYLMREWGRSDDGLNEGEKQNARPE